MHKIECLVETMITVVAIFAMASVVFPSLGDLPVPTDTKIELRSRPSHD